MRNFNRKSVIPFLAILCVIFFIPTLYAQNESENPIIPAISAPGKHSVMWSAKDMTSGVYFCTVKAGTFSDTRKMTLLK